MAQASVIPAHEGDEVLLQLLDRNGFILGINPAWISVLGLASEDCVGRAAREFVAEPDRPGYLSFLANLGAPGASPYHHAELLGRPGLTVSAVISGRKLGDGGIACEIWTLDGLAHTMERARRQAARDRAEAAVMRTVSAVSDLLVRTRSVGAFLRELRLLLEVVSGTGRVHMEAADKRAPWMLPLAAALRARFGETRATDGALLTVDQLAAISPALPDTFGDTAVMVLWVADETLAEGRRHIVAALPKDGALRESWGAHVGLFAQAVGNALSCLAAWETQARLLQEAHAQSVTDPLMRIFNRYKLEETLAAEEQRARRYGTWFSVVIADIDHFKVVNDTYGHPVGDVVLAEIADELRTHLRTTDILGRWGGEEIMIVCIHTRQEVAVGLAELLRRRIAARRFAGIAGLTVSFGVASFEDGDTAAEVVARADAALYAAKGEGRNRVCERWRAVPEPPREAELPPARF